MQPEHLPRVLEIERELFPSDPWTLQGFEYELHEEGKTRHTVVALIDGAVVGYVGIAYFPPAADISTFAVATEHQGQGIGSTLFSYIMSFALSVGCTSVMLEVDIRSRKEIEIYQHFGFAIIAERPNYYGPGLTAYVMRTENLDRWRHV